MTNNVDFDEPTRPIYYEEPCIVLVGTGNPEINADYVGNHVRRALVTEARYIQM